MKARYSARRAMHASMVPRVMALAVVLVVSAWTKENILRNQNPTKCPAHWPAHVCKRQALLPQSVSYEKLVRGGTCGDGCSMELATILCHIVHQFGHHEQRPHSHKHKKYTYTRHTNTHSQPQIPPHLLSLNMKAISHANLICFLFI